MHPLSASRRPVAVVRGAVLALFVVGLFAALPLPGRAAGATWYVSSLGHDDQGTGSFTSPFATLRHALQRADAGDTVVLRGGTYVGGVSIERPQTTVRSYPGEWAVLIAPTNNSNTPNALRFGPNATGSRLERVELRGGYDAALLFDSLWNTAGSDRHGVTGVVVEDCVVRSSGTHGIVVSPNADNNTVRRTEIAFTGLRDAGTGAGIDCVNADGFRAEANYIHHVSTHGIVLRGGSSNSVVERNTVTYTDGGGVMIGHYSLASDLDVNANPDLYESLDARVQNNVIANTGGAGVGFFAAAGSLLFNNTLVDTGAATQPPVVIDYVDHTLAANDTVRTPSANLTIQNNIIQQSQAGADAILHVRQEGLEGDFTLSNNRYFHPHRRVLFRDENEAGAEWDGDLAQWQQHTGSDAGSSEGDPRLDATYHLRTNSPLINAGVTLPLVTNDVDGDARTGAYDIGADEFVSGTSIQFSASAYRVEEEQGQAVITVRRVGSGSGAVSVNYTTGTGGTATAGDDYVPTSGTLNWADGDRSPKTFTVRLGQDAPGEPDETVILTLSSPGGGATLGMPSTATLTIVDSDNTPASVSINTATVTEGDSGTVNATFTVTLSKATADDVTVEYGTNDDTAVAGTDYQATSGTVTIPAGSRSATITVPVLGDTVEEPQETFWVELRRSVNAALGNRFGRGSIVDDDTPVRLSVSGASVVEGQSGTTNLVFALRLSAPSDEPVTVDYTTAGGTATAGSDYVAAAGTVTFPAGVTRQTVSVTVNGDTAVEPDETVTLQLSNVSGAVMGTGQAAGTIVNDDAGAPSISGFSPARGGVGTIVTLQGSGFLRASSVRFNGRDARFTVDSNNVITATVPAGATTGRVTVVTPVGTATSAVDFVVVARPVINKIAPKKGKVGGKMTITGQNFTGVTSVTINGVAASFTVVSDTKITAIVPDNAASAGRITVISPGGAATSADSFSVQQKKDKK